MVEGPLGGNRPFAESKLALEFQVRVPNTREGEEMLERKAQLYSDVHDIGDRPTSHGEMREQAGEHIPNVILSTFESLTKSQIYLEDVDLSDTKSRNPEHTSSYEEYELTYTIDKIWHDEWAMKQINTQAMVRLHKVFIEENGEPDRYRNERNAKWPSTWSPEELDIEMIYAKVM